MAKFSNVNNTANFSVASGCATYLLAFKAVAIAAGWTIPRSSDGITYNSTGDQITTANTGAGGMQNVSAWFVMREPGGRREWCLQHNNATGAQMAVRVKYSPVGRFIGGSPSATRVPSATDEQTLFGGGTDASPTYSGINNSNPARYHIVFNSTPISGCYPFIAFFVTPGSGNAAPGFWAQEPMAPGSFSASDLDPCVVHCSNAPAGAATWSTYFAFGTAGQVWTASVTLNPGLFTGSMGVDLGDGSDVNGYPVFSATLTGASRIKGIASTIASKGPARTYPATTNTATDAKVYLGAYANPFPNNTVPLV